MRFLNEEGTQTKFWEKKNKNPAEQVRKINPTRKPETDYYFWMA